MKKYVISAILTLFATIIDAQESQTGYNFLRLPVSAHAAALGGDNITLIEDDEALIFHNPALLSSVNDKTVLSTTRLRGLFRLSLLTTAR